MQGSCFTEEDLLEELHNIFARGKDAPFLALDISKYGPICDSPATTHHEQPAISKGRRINTFISNLPT
ncbi:hypothetical protein SESBI_28554 [Sesbania bispinosa]|nr:hypothetical protein SESBI_28554 [Sesbania bispinosa]